MPVSRAIWQAAFPHSPPSRSRAAAPAVLATRMIDSVSSIWHTALAGGAPSLGRCPSSPCRVASRFRASSMHISWHAAPGSRPAEAATALEIFWRHSRNKRRCHGPRTPQAPLASAGRAKYLMPISFYISSHSRHEPGSIVLVQIVYRGPRPCH